MRNLTTDEACAYLEFATIEKTIDVRYAFVHIGLNAMGGRFVLVNDAQGNNGLTESM